MNKTCLFLKAAAAACADEEAVITAHLKGIGVKTEVVEWLSPQDFEIQVTGKKFGIIYLGAHANAWGFGENDQTLHPWETLGTVICTSDCMVPEGTLFLGCCRGGMKTVALKILMQCDKIDYIMGPNWNSKGGDLAAAFVAFTRSRLIDGEEPAKAAARATEAAGQMFTCYDRQKLEAEVELLRKLTEIGQTQDFMLRMNGEMARTMAKVQEGMLKISARLESAPVPSPSSAEGP